MKRLSAASLRGYLPGNKVFHCYNLSYVTSRYPYLESGHKRNRKHNHNFFVLILIKLLLVTNDFP